MVRSRAVAGIGLVAAILVGCRGGEQANRTLPPPKVTVVRPVATEVQAHWTYNGNLESPKITGVRARAKGILTHRFFKEGAEVKGGLGFRWINGETIPTGDLLYQIDKKEHETAQKRAAANLENAESEVTKAKATIGIWEAEVKFAEAEANRVEEAVRRTGASKNELDKATATVGVNQAQLEAAKADLKAKEAARDAAIRDLHTANIQLSYTNVRAPMSGQIGRTRVTIGNLVGQNEATLLTTIIKVDELYVNFDVPEQDLLQYKRGLEEAGLPPPPERRIPIEVRIPGEGNEWHVGEVDYVEAFVNPDTGTARVRGVLPNPRQPSSQLRVFVPGLYVQVRLPRGQSESQLTLPEDAIMTGQEGRYVYVIGEENKVEKRVVELGPQVWKAPPTSPGTSVPGWVMVNPNPGPAPEKGPPPATRRDVPSVVAIVSGLKPDDRVIVDGLQRARPGLPAVPVEWQLKPPTAPAK